MAQLEFELVYDNIAVKHFTHYATEIQPERILDLVDILIILAVKMSREMCCLVELSQL